MKILIALIFTLTSSAFAQEIYKITDKTIKGEEFQMESLKDKVVLIVNIASQCGYTSQLEGLEGLYQKYKGQNFVVLGVPTNDFGGQTPEDDANMLEFCQKNYAVTFPILTKKTISGGNKRELYQYLTEKSPKEFRGKVEWNFEKFLIDRAGKVVGRYKSKVATDDKNLVKKIQETLK